MADALREKTADATAVKNFTSQEVLQMIERERVIASIRMSIFENVEGATGALQRGGIRLFAISTAVPQRHRFMESFSNAHPEVLVGACHVISGEQAQRAIESGAKFVSSPFVTKDVITVCRNSGVLVIQGAQTATEVMDASNSGADMVQIYPVHLLGGPLFIRTLRDPLPPLKFVASGGLTLENVVEFIRAGSAAVMVDDALSDRSLVRDNKWDEITDCAKAFTDKIATLKGSK